MPGIRTLVLGATGNTGRAVVRHLVDDGRSTVRTATRAAEPAGADEHEPFDWFDPAGHPAALQGVDRVYLVAPAGAAEPVAVVEPFVQLALAHGVRRVVMLSSSAVEPGEPGLGLVDALVRDVVPEWAVLRPSWFMQNFVGDHPLAESIRSGRQLVTATGDGRLGFIDAADIGRTAASLLAADTITSGAHVLTGPESLSYSDAARIIGDAIGSPVTHTSVTTERYGDILTEAGYDAGFASALAGLDERIASGAQDLVTDSVEQITGRRPRRFADFVSEHAHLL